MAGGKETPRQKMIGMMYLVLTALLAMNISKDVLNAFIQINRGMVKNAANSEERADATMLLLDSWSDGTKAAPFQAEAHKFVDEADALVNYIIELKARVLAASVNGSVDGAGFEEYIGVYKDNINFKDFEVKPIAQGGHLIDIGDKEKVSKPDENQNTTGILIGSDPHKPRSGAWSAVELREKLTAFANRAIGIEVIDIKGKSHKLAEGAPETKGLIEKTFKFEDINNSDGEPEKWETALFYHTPVSAVIAHLSKIEGDVILAKNAVLNYLTSQINSSDLKFSDVTVAVVPKQSYIMRGDSFVAEIYLAAYNKNSTTRVYMSGSEAGDNPTPEKFDYSGITPITSGSDGKCKFKINQSGLGAHSHKGIIVYQDASGEDKEIPFVVPPYFVGEPNCVISPTNMMILYRGISNPVEVSVPGVDPSSMSVTCSGGSMSGSGGKYNIDPGAGAEVTVSVSATINGKSVSVGSRTFEVKAMPTAETTLSGRKKSGEGAPKSDIINGFVKCSYPDAFPMGKNLSVEITNCKLSVNGIDLGSCPGGRLNASQVSKLSGLKKGDVVLFNQVATNRGGGLPLVLTITQ
jgi:gliding motility-associated protein GldM